MRLDLFLKTARLIKRRAIAREMCDKGKVLVNGLQAKPAKDVRPGDLIILKLSSRTVDLEVLGLPAPTSRKVLPEELFRIRAEMRLPKGNDLWNENLSSS